MLTPLGDSQPLSNWKADLRQENHQRRSRSARRGDTEEVIVTENVIDAASKIIPTRLERGLVCAKAPRRGARE
jgi:hypothetical protein